MLGRRAEDVDEFMEKLEGTGAFQDIVPATQDRTEDGLYRAAIQSVYSTAEDQPADQPAKAVPAARPAAPGRRR